MHTKECPPQPVANATRTVREAHEKWISDNEKTRIYLVASMTEVFYSKQETMTATFEMIESLQTMFGQPSKQKRHEAIRFAMITRMEEGSSVRDISWV